MPQTTWRRQPGGCRDMPQRPPPRPNGLAQPVGVRYNPLHLMINLEAADIVKVKVMKQGGLLRCLRAIDMAEAAGIRCVIGHGFGLTLNTLAELHVAAVSANVLDGCECVGPTKLTGGVVGGPGGMESGGVAAP